MALSPEQMVKIVEKLKKLFDAGALGSRAASTDNPMLPGEFMDLVWYLIFGRERQEDDTRGAAFIFGMWKDQPLLSWNIKELPRGELVSLLAMSIAMIGRKGGKSIVPEMISALSAIQEREDAESAELEQDTAGQKPH